MALTAAQIKETMKGMIPMTYPERQKLDCCVMLNPDGDWFAFFTANVTAGRRREIEESVYEEMASNYMDGEDS